MNIFFFNDLEHSSNRKEFCFQKLYAQTAIKKIKSLNGMKYVWHIQILFVFNCYRCIFIYIKGCKKIGVYGVDCNIPCPMNCKDNMCHTQYGTCYACQPGWTGTTCSASTTVLKISIFLFIIIFSLIFNLKDINPNLYVHCLISIVTINAC